MPVIIRLVAKVLILSIVSMFIFTTESIFAKEFHNHATPQTYDGMATPISTITITMGFNDMNRGVVTYTPMPGTFFNGPILDVNGKIVVQGDLLIVMEKEYRKAEVENAEAAYTKNEAILTNKKEVYLRNKVLQKKGVVSLQSFQKSYSDYLQAVAQLKADYATLLLKKKILSFCDYYAKFDGIVNKVMFSAGYTGGERPIMEVSQLFPMGINIKMARSLASKIDVDTPITVYPLNSKKQIGAIHGASRLLNDGIQIVVNNFPINNLYEKVNGKKLPIIHNVETVIPFNFLDQSKSHGSLAIDINCIMKEGTRSYVLKAVGQKNEQPGKGIESVILLHKCYIIPGKLINRITPSVNYIQLQDSGSLELNDLILRTDDIKKYNLKADDSVYYYYQKERYLFMPGDPVKVLIGGPTN